MGGLIWGIGYGGLDMGGLIWGPDMRGLIS